MISGKGPSAEIPLQQLGIPLWPIVTLRTESGERFVELTGDARLVIPPISKSEGAE